MRLNLKIPESWNELTVWQLKKIAHMVHSENHGILFDYKVFLVLLKVRWWAFFKKWKLNKVLKETPLSVLKTHYNWFYDSLELTVFIPTLKATSQLWHAPADRLTNITMDEFSHAEDLYLGWSDSKDFEYLRYLAAVLYRENDDNGKRVKFDKTELDKRTKQIKKINQKNLLAIVLSYQGSRGYLFAQYPTVFPKTKQAVKAPKTSGFGKLVLHFSGGKFGTYNETKNTNVYTFLSEFEEQLKKKPNA